MGDFNVITLAMSSSEILVSVISSGRPLIMTFNTLSSGREIVWKSALHLVR